MWESAVEGRCFTKLSPAKHNLGELKIFIKTACSSFR
mgnify:CR=1 FL=1